METAKAWKPTPNGTPQGAVICQRPPALPFGLPPAGYLAPLGCPLLANIYLNPLDHEMARRNRRMLRFADDFIVLCHTEAEAREVLAEVQQWVAEAGLTLHPEKTRIVNVAAGEGFEFASRGRAHPFGAAYRL